MWRTIGTWLYTLPKSTYRVILAWIHKQLYGDSPLHSAVRSFYRDDTSLVIVKYLLERDNSQVNVRNLEDETPLHLAIQNYNCSAKLMKLLLDHGADVNATLARNGNTVLHHWVSVSKYINYEVGMILLRRASDVNARNLKGDTPLHLALRKKSFVPFLVLLHNNEVTDVHVANLKGDTPLHLYLCRYVERDFSLFWIFDKARDVNIVNSKGDTPLHVAVRNPHYATVLFVKMLLDHGADVSKRNAKCETAYQAYYRAVKQDRYRKADPMLKKLLQPNVQQYMDSSLHVASLFHNVESVSKLLRMGADVNAVDESGFPPVFYAILTQGRDLDKFDSTVRLLLDYGADINQLLLNRFYAAIWPWQESYYVFWPSWKTQYSQEASVLEAALQGKIRKTTATHHQTMKLIFLEHLAKLFSLHEKLLEKGIDLQVLSNYNRNMLRRQFQIENLDPHYKGLFGAEYETWLSLSSEELEAMSVETELPFLDLLIANAEEMTSYAKNKELVKTFQAKKAMFPMYQGMLDSKLDRELERRKLLESAAAAMSDALRFADPSDEFFERTLSYCSNKDLVHVIKAMQLNT